jgi:inner membrane protein
MFYLLELSLAEHIGFLYSYLAATAAIVLMICLYAGAVLGKFSRALGIAGVLLLLYGYLYVLLKNQDYALLVGSIGLFVMLGTVMYLTRRIDWYALPESEK